MIIGLQDLYVKEKLDPGIYDIVVTQFDMFPIERTIEVSEGDNKILNLYPSKKDRARLIVKTIEGADIIINDILYKGPILDKVFESIETEIIITKYKHERITKIIYLKSGETYKLKLFPRKIYGLLSIKTFPDAQLQINEKQFKGSVSNISVLEKIASIKIIKDGYKNIVEEKSFNSYDHIKLELYPDKITGTIDVRVLPSSSVVTIYDNSGKEKEIFNNVGSFNTSLLEGDYLLEISCVGYNIHRENFSIVKDKLIRKFVNLTKERLLKGNFYT